MENENSNFETFETLKLEGETKSYMLEAARWGRFLGIVGFVSCAIILIFSLYMLFVGSALETIPGMPMGGSTRVIGITYLIMAVIMFFPAKFLYTFSIKMIAAITGSSQTDFNYSVENLKSWLKFTGIVTIIYLSFVGLFLLIGLLAIAAAV